jgi:hypothetical protein
VRAGAGDDHGVERNPNERGVRQVRLPGGGLLTVRRVTPADVDGLVALYGGLSDVDRYSRFFSGYRPPRSFFERLASVAERGGYGVIATVGADGSAAGARGDAAPVVGEASYELLPNGNGELSMTVASDHRGWLGPYLLDALVEAGRSRGVHNLEADVLVTNRRMLGLLRARGCATVGSSDWTSLRLLVGTGGHVPTWPADPRTGLGDRPRVLVETPGGRWHASAEAQAAGLQVIACTGPRGSRPRCPVLAGQPCPLAAGADAIVMSSAPDDERWLALADAHGELHTGVPVCVEPRARQVAGQPDVTALDDGRGVLTVDHRDRCAVVDVVDRLARLHSRARRGGGVRP